MREIKFRVWDKVHEEMIEWEKYKDELVSQDFTDNNLVIMQYTGYEDEEWTEIYEGDIVDFVDYSFEGKSEYNCRGLVMFGDGTWHVTNSITASELFNYEDGEMKVIGNIFENPELIEFN